MKYWEQGGKLPPEDNRSSLGIWVGVLIIVFLLVHFIIAFPHALDDNLNQLTSTKEMHMTETDEKKFEPTIKIKEPENQGEFFTSTNADVSVEVRTQLDVDSIEY